MPTLNDLDQLIAEEAAFQNYLLYDHYTYIGPSPQNIHFNTFIQAANKLAPVVNHGKARDLRDVLAHSESTIKALSFLPEGAEIDVYAGKNDGNIGIFGVIKDYCQQNKITYPEKNI